MRSPIGLVRSKLIADLGVEADRMFAKGAYRLSPRLQGPVDQVTSVTP
jgi:hypothetical protein